MNRLKRRWQKVPRKRKQNMIMIFFFSAAILLMVFYIWIFNHTNMMIGEIDELKIVEAHLETEKRVLRADIDRLSRADRIKQIAFLHLDMVTPQPETLAVIIEHPFPEDN